MFVIMLLSIMASGLVFHLGGRFGLWLAYNRHGEFYMLHSTTKDDLVFWVVGVVVILICVAIPLLAFAFLSGGF